MATDEDVRRIASVLPDTTVGHDGLSCSVGGKAFSWPWLERIHPKKARVPRHDVLAIRVTDDMAKHSLLAVDPDVFFTEAHYSGYPAVLVRLPAVEVELLEDLLTDAWRTRASRRLREEFDARQATGEPSSNEAL